MTSWRKRRNLSRSTGGAPAWTVVLPMHTRLVILRPSPQGEKGSLQLPGDCVTSPRRTKKHLQSMQFVSHGQRVRADSMSAPVERKGGHRVRPYERARQHGGITPTPFAYTHQTDPSDSTRSSPSWTRSRSSRNGAPPPSTSRSGRPRNPTSTTSARCSASRTPSRRTPSVTPTPSRRAPGVYLGKPAHCS
jgi:hypothetical protein